MVSSISVNFNTDLSHQHQHNFQNLPPSEEPKLPIPIPPISCINATCGPLSSSTTRVSTDPSPLCPDYFRWIHEDLRPWKETGITEEMVVRARRTASFRLVIVDGRSYIERYKTAFQTRDSLHSVGNRLASPSSPRESRCSQEGKGEITIQGRKAR